MSKAITLMPRTLKTKIEDVTLLELLTLTQEELFTYLKKHLPKDCTKVVADNIIVNPPRPKDTTYRPLLCSHLDTVSPTPPKKEDLIIKAGTISLDPKSKATCLGGDCRAGVYTMLKLIFSENFCNYSYAFFVFEEIGCVGSTAFTATQEFADIEAHTSAFISIDRQCDPGKPEIATYDYDDPDLDDWMALNLPQFKQTYGSYTDCSVLSAESLLLVPCFNMSAGYRREHTRAETIHVPTMLKTLQALQEVTLPDQQFEYEPMAPTIGGKYDFGDYCSPTDWKTTTNNVAYIPGAPICCDLCGTHSPLFESEDGFNYVCENCYHEN